MIKIKRVYEKPAKSDGFRILIDRLWPRGVSKKEARVDLWLKDVAPSNALRKWFSHDPKKWPVFKEKYFQELKKNKAAVNELCKAIRGKTTTFLYGAKDEKRNNAAVLKKFIE